MPIDYLANTASFTDMCEIELAESLLEWVLDHPEGCVDLSRCTHMHTAVLQVLMALKPDVAEWPAEEGFSQFMQAAMSREMTA